MSTLFSDAQLNQVVSDALQNATLPTGHTNAVVVATDATGASVVASFKLGDTNQWDVQGYYRHDFTTNDNTVGARVVYSW